MIRPSHHGFMKGRSCLTHLIACDTVSCSVGEGTAGDAVCLGCSKASDTASHSIFLEKVAVRGLDGCTLKTLSGWLGPKGCGEWS